MLILNSSVRGRGTENLKLERGVFNLTADKLSFYSDARFGFVVACDKTSKLFSKKEVE